MLRAVGLGFGSMQSQGGNGTPGRLSVGIFTKAVLGSAVSVPVPLMWTGGRRWQSVLGNPRGGDCKKQRAGESAVSDRWI